MTSLTFMLVEVPLPVWKMSTGNWRSWRPSSTSAAACSMAEARSAGISPSRPLTRAAAALMQASARSNSRGMGPAADREVLDGTGGLRAVERVLGNRHLAHGVALDSFHAPLWPQLLPWNRAQSSPPRSGARPRHAVQGERAHRLRGMAGDHRSADRFRCTRSVCRRFAGRILRAGYRRAHGGDALLQAGDCGARAGVRQRGVHHHARYRGAGTTGAGAGRRCDGGGDAVLRDAERSRNWRSITWRCAGRCGCR